MVDDYLSSHNFRVSIESRGDSAAERILQESPDAVLLDVNLPGKDGFAVCREVRAQYPGVIIILTARGDEIDEVVGLELGADDYMSKPVRPRVLLARLRLHLRKATPSTSGPPRRIEIGSLKIDASSRTVELEGESIELTTMEFDLLWMLAENVGEVVSRNTIYQEIHGIAYDGLDRSVDLCISRLRKKIGDNQGSPQRIKSIRAIGYLLSAEQ